MSRQLVSNAIEVEGLGKRYRLGEGLASGTLRDAVSDGVARALRRGGRSRDEAADVWALRDVDLAVPQGASLGIVGRNGAGKSTLLKVLARITEPTVGVSRTRGAVGSLLEVGTGFHPELTGRENVFLNAAVLGMPRAVVAARLDDIVDFSGIGRFLDTPVKRYSSGMYLRLAFAVAAHVDADVLLVDEVLAVGDAEFQRRCLGRMEDLGRVRGVGRTADVVDDYLREATPDAGRRTFAEDPDSPVSLLGIDVREADGRSAGRLRREEPFVVEVDLGVRERVPGLDLAVSVETLNGVRLLDEALSDTAQSGSGPLAGPGRHRVSLTLPPLLMPGEYLVNVWAGTTYETLVWEHGAARLRLEGSHQARPDRLLAAQGVWTVTAAAPR